VILNIDNDDSREFLLTSFSNSLNFNNGLTLYNGGRKELEPLFTLHAYHIPMSTAENNVWGVKIGRGTFIKNYKTLKNGKKFNLQPFEKYKKNNKTKTIYIQNEKIEGKLAKDFSELNNGKNTFLLCQTSENLKEQIPDESIDAVITDPPYYSNVQYSELADFFYVWLREALKEKYPEFGPELSPKLSEIVKNTVQKKDDEFFISGLKTVFSECNRVLKSGGRLIFTFHHKEAEGWEAVLKSILESGFMITGIYPVLSEIKQSIHIKGTSSIEYDAIFICQKKISSDSITFDKFEEELYLKTQKVVSHEIKKRPTLSKGDISVIVFGKCLEIYSKYYPNITKNGKPVPVKDAIEKVWEIIEQLTEEDTYIPGELDPITRAFIANAFDKNLTYDELNKRLRNKGIDVAELEAEKLIHGPKNNKSPTDPMDRKSFIEKKLEKGDDILDIDKAHYLYILFTTDKNTSTWLKKWKTPELEQLCNILAEKTGDKRYSDLMKMSLDMF